MQEMSIFWLRVAAALYSVGLLHAILAALRRKSQWFRPALVTFVAAVVLHLVSLVELGVALGHLPADNFYESISMCAFLIAVVFLFLYWRYRFSSLAVVLFPLVFVMTLIGATEVPVQSWTNPAVRTAWLKVHVLLVLCGYAALLITAVASVFYLVQERRLKNKRAGLLEKLPPLGTIDNLISSSMGFGFAFITLSVIAGSIWAFIETGTRWIGDPRVVISLVTWAFYLLMVFLRAGAGWRGRKAAIMALSVLSFSALTWVTHAGLGRLLSAP